MKSNKAIFLMFVVMVGSAQAYFWEDWGKELTPQEQIESRKIDLEYEKKIAEVQHKQEEARRKAYEKSYDKASDLALKKEKLELERQKKRLELEKK